MSGILYIFYFLVSVMFMSCLYHQALKKVQNTLKKNVTQIFNNRVTLIPRKVAESLQSTDDSPHTVFQFQPTFFLFTNARIDVKAIFCGPSTSAASFILDYSTSIRETVRNEKRLLFNVIHSKEQKQQQIIIFKCLNVF